MTLILLLIHRLQLCHLRSCKVGWESVEILSFMCHLKIAESHQKSGWMAVAPTLGISMISDSGMFKLFETLGASALYDLIDSKWLLL